MSLVFINIFLRYQRNYLLPKKKKILDQVNSPADLRSLSHEDLKSLSDDVRQKIIDVVEEKGGHFSSPLGVVDLTVALHKVFETPEFELLKKATSKPFIVLFVTVK